MKAKRKNKARLNNPLLISLIVFTGIALFTLLSVVIDGNVKGVIESMSISSILPALSVVGILTMLAFFYLGFTKDRPGEDKIDLRSFDRLADNPPIIGDIPENETSYIEKNNRGMS